MRWFWAVALAAIMASGTAACGGGDEGIDPPASTTTTVAVTLTTSPDLDPRATGEQILVTAGARDAVLPGEGAEERLADLAESWCTTALRSDVDNADATFRYSLNEFFTRYGLLAADGEIQDVPLGKAMLAGTYAGPLATAGNQLLCPEVQRPTG